jgi:hypothetical protein
MAVFYGGGEGSERYRFRSSGVQEFTGSGSKNLEPQNP